MHDYQVLTNGSNKDEGLAELVNANKEFFAPYYGLEGWQRFIDLHFLNEYVDDSYKPIISSKGYYYWRTWYMTDEEYFEEARRYCDFSTRIIQSRAKRMIDKLQSKIFGVV